MVDTQLIALLTEYAQNPARTLEEVCLKLQISLAHGRRLMKKFAYAMAATQKSDPDYPRLAAEKLGVNEAIAFALEGQIEKYADLTILNELQRSGIGPGARGITTDAFAHQQMMPPQEHVTAASLAGSNPYKILVWLLTSVFKKDIDPQKADGFLELFRIEEDNFMHNPMILQQRLEERFGMKMGRAVFGQFYDMVATRLGPSQQFGAAQWGGNLGHIGPQSNIGPWQNAMNGWNPNAMSAANFYQAKGIIPSGVDPNSPEAQRAVDQYEHQQHMKLQDDEIQMKLKNLLNMRMVEMVDQKNMNGGGGMMGGPMGGMGGPMGQGMNAIGPYVASGQVRMIVRTGANGQPETVWENTALGGGQNTNGEQMGMADIMSRFYTQMLESQKQSTALFQPFMEKIINRGLGVDQQQSPFSQFKEIKELIDSVNPPNRGFNDSIEAAKLMIADKRIESDREVALKSLDNKRMDEVSDRDWEHKQEEMSGKRMDNFMNTVIGQGLKTFGPVIEAVVASKLAGGGGGPPGGMATGGPMPTMGGGYAQQPGGGPPPQQQGPPRRMPGRQVTPDDIYRARAADATYASSMTEGQRAAELAAQAERDARERLAQQSHDQENAWAAVAQARTYTPQDFSSFPDEKLYALKMQGKAWMQSAKNFEEALTVAEQERISRINNQGPTTFTQPQGAIPTGAKFTEVSPEAAAAAEVAASTYPANPPPQQQQEGEQSQQEEPTIDLDDASQEEYKEDDDEVTAREDETGQYEDSGVVAATKDDPEYEEGDIA